MLPPSAEYKQRVHLHSCTILLFASVSLFVLSGKILSEDKCSDRARDVLEEGLSV